MPNYHRVLISGGTYFFTVVTYHRQRILTSPQSRSLLHSALENVQKRYPFTVDAVCLLPDHIHCIWTLPAGETDFALRWGEFKRVFTQSYHRHIGMTKTRSTSRTMRGEGAIWQRRFWEHLIRDEQDYHNHLDYIHYNPVKHGYVRKVADWPWSSFHRYVAQDLYPADWGMLDDRFAETRLFGE